MTVIGQDELLAGDGLPSELIHVIEALTAAAASTSQAAQAVTAQAAAANSDPAYALGQRIVALRSGNVAQREIARFMHRCLDLAEAIGRPRHEDNSEAADVDVPSRYRLAIEGVDASTTIASALAATHARLINAAYVHAREELLDPTLTPGQRVEHTHGSIDATLGRDQITGADLSVVLDLPPMLAKLRVNEATTLVQHMPLTLARLQAGELSEYHQRLIAQEVVRYPPELAQRLDDLLSTRPFTGRHVGAGDHRASTRTVKRRLSKAVAMLGLEPPDTTTRKTGFAGRYVRFGLTTEDGMTRLHGALPSLHAKAIDTLLDDLARSASDEDQRSIEQRRADAFLTMFTGPAALSPAAQLELGMSAPSFDEHGQYTVIDDDQNLEAVGAWETIRLLAATLNLTFPDVPRAIVNVDVSLETLTGTTCTATARSSPGNARPHDRPPDESQQPYPPPKPQSALRCSSFDPPGRLPAGCRPTHDDTFSDQLTPEPDLRHRVATLRGVGDIPDCLAYRLARFADLRRIVTDPLTGQPLEVGRRRPSHALRTAVLNRDRHCRFPGCTRPAALDLDHIEPYRDEIAAPCQTVPHNLHALCREHHRVKHQLRWNPAVRPDGSVVWRNNLLDITAIG